MQETLEAGFDPAEDSRAFRNALGQFATGVTLITTMTADGPAGIVANSFASVSLDPPLVLWSPAKGANRFPIFAPAEHYAIHVLAADQQEACAAFAKSKDAFDQVTWANGPHDVPLIEGTRARFLCQKAAAHDAGDHVIIVGKVLNATSNPGPALTFHNGQYGRA